MRDLPPDIQEKINLLNQSIYNNAQPSMEAVIVKAVKTLDMFTVRENLSLGAIDVSVETDASGMPVKLWIIAAVDKRAVVTVHDPVNRDILFSTFMLTTEEVNAKVFDVAIEFDGIWIDSVFISSGAPYLFWVERGIALNKIWTIQWDGQGVQPLGKEMLSVVR